MSPDGRPYARAIRSVGHAELPRTERQESRRELAPTSPAQRHRNRNRNRRCHSSARKFSPKAILLPSRSAISPFRSTPGSVSIDAGGARSARATPRPRRPEPPRVFSALAAAHRAVGPRHPPIVAAGVEGTARGEPINCRDQVVEHLVAAGFTSPHRSAWAMLDSGGIPRTSAGAMTCPKDP